MIQHTDGFVQKKVYEGQFIVLRACVFEGFEAAAASGEPPSAPSCFKLGAQGETMAVG